MEKSNAEKIFQTMQKFQKHSLNAKVMGKIPRSEIMMLKMIKMNTPDTAGVTISALGEGLQISKPAVSQMINVLEEKGHVERVTTKEDRRIVYVRLTKLGEQTLEKAFQSLLKSLNEIFAEMGEEDTQTLLRLLEKLYSIVSERGLSCD